MEKMKTRSAKRVSEPKPAVATPAAVKKVVDTFVSATTPTAPVRTRVSADEYIQRVQFKAHEIYVQRNYSHGNDLADWLEAERLVKVDLGL